MNHAFKSHPKVMAKEMKTYLFLTQLKWYQYDLKYRLNCVFYILTNFS